MKEAMMSGKGVIISKLLIQLIHHKIMDLFSLLYQFLELLLQIGTHTMS